MMAHRSRLRINSPAMWAISVSVVLLAVLAVPSGAQYCTVRGCCPGRNDDCTTPIHDTLCYCDIFCNTTALDCCPDFWEYCIGIKPPTEPPTTTRPSRETTPKPINYCLDGGVIYKPGANIQINCNKCTCVQHLDGTSYFQCENNECLIDPDIIEKINSESNLGWTAGNYSFLWGLTKEEGVRYRLGTFPPGTAVASMIEVKIETDDLIIPESFDSRSEWPGFIGDVVDQGNCGSSWAISTSGVASDRLTIQSKGALSSRLSQQHLLSCNVRGQRGCSGGYLDRAWWYMRKPGILSSECYPYQSGLTETTYMRTLDCRIPYGSSTCPEPGVKSDVYQSTPPYRIATRERDIMAEILLNGPVQAAFNVRHDFFMYNGGVYRHSFSGFAASQADASQPGWHSVRIIGWGVDRSDPARPVNYWRCANSWGQDWGEEGLFRIVRGENESEIESFVLGVWMRVDRRYIG